MKRLTIFLIFASMLTSCALENMDAIADRVFDLARYQLVLMDSNLKDGEMPRTVEDGRLAVSDIKWWCSGFYPGSLCLTALYTGDPLVATLADKYTHFLDTLSRAKNSHDIGFMLNCSFGNHLLLFPSAAAADSAVLREGADKLAARFSPITGTTRSWDFGKWKWPVIIDNMMNLELLMKFGTPAQQEMAISHAEKTIENHFRDNYTTWHVVDYDPETGAVRGKQTHQGLADDSSWGRGQAWALYGYTMMAVQCAEKGYSEAAAKFKMQSERVAEMLLAKLPDDGIPAWDFDAPEPALKDASAGAIMASAFVQLSGITGGKLSRRCLAMAEKQIRALASPEYLSKKGEDFGFILKHSVGNMPRNSEVDVPLTYADYYFLEALMRITDK